MLTENLDKKKTENLLKSVKAKRWVRLNAVAYLAAKLDIKLPVELVGSDEEEEDDRSRSKRSKKGKDKQQPKVLASDVTNKNLGHFMALLQKLPERVLPVWHSPKTVSISSFVVII